MRALYRQAGVISTILRQNWVHSESAYRGINHGFSHQAVDELNAQLGVLKAELEGPEAAVLRASLEQIQQQLFNLGGDLALPGGCLLRAQAVEWLETQIDDWNRSLPPLQNFVLPGGSRANAQAHLARAVARRAERQVVALTETPGPEQPGR